MATNYDVLASERTDVTLSSGDVVDGEDATIQAKPSGVVFHVVVVVNEQTFNDPSQLAAAIDDVASPYADYFNQDVQVSGVVDLTTFQAPDANQNLRSNLSATISSRTNPLVQATRSADITTAIPDRFQTFVSQTQDSLDALAAS
jgi:hypothetical protein